MESEYLDYMFKSAMTAILEASNSVMAIYNNDHNYNVNIKSDNTLIIEADRVSHETIRKCLAKTRIPLMSEEGRNIMFEERYSWELYWLIDPIDGTLEFVNKSKEFSICIALMENNTPLVGIIAAPALKQIYYACKGSGTYRIDNVEMNEGITHNINQILSNATKISCDTSFPADNIKVLTTLSNPNKETEDMINMLSNRFSRVDRYACGSALKFCRMAEGAAHLYFRTTPLKDWDTAAGEIIAIESGLRVLSLTGSTLNYNKQDMIIDPFMVSYHSNLTQ